jgi:replication-associated recombination protein RarA
VRAALAAGKDPWSAIEPCFVLKGPPGAGKTTIARALGAMFHSLGLIAEPAVVEKTAAGLTTGYVGQSGRETRKAMDEGLGRVLLIDEAHTLAQTHGTFNEEVRARVLLRMRPAM